ncbi:hypothetical protein GEMRC1_012302 [Eukaryota sp. GEM-RC1]
MIVPFLLLLAFGLCLADDRSSVPGWMLTNFNDTMLTLRQKTLSFTQKPDFPAGISSLRIAPRFSINSLYADSFAFKYRGKVYAPFDYDLTIQQLPDGSVETCAVSPTSSPFPFTLCRVIFFPPNKPFYVSEFTFKPVNPSDSIYLLHFVISDSDDQHTAWAWRDKDHGNQFMIDLRKLNKGYLSFDSFPSSPPLSWEVGPANGKNSPLNRFILCEDKQVMISLLFHLSSDSPSTFTFTTVQQDWSPAVTASTEARSRTPSHWRSLLTEFVSSWSKKTIKPKSLSIDHDQAFTNAMLSFKYGQNPLIGAITASFHPSYAFKSWTRDGLFASIILSSTGHYDEAKAYIEFLATVPLTDGHFHTTYSTFDGSISPFVEPQTDSSGLYPLAVLYYLSASKSKDLSNDVYKRVFDLMDVWVDSISKTGLGTPDYSIWEESSAPEDGHSLPTAFFTFSQALGAAGLRAAAKICRKQGMIERAKLYESAFEILSGSILENFNTGEYFGRSLSQDSELDLRVDASTAALIFTGLVKGNDARNRSGIARYQNDIFFYKSVFNPNGQESSEPEPAWTVTTMFVALAELALKDTSLVQKRLDWMVERSARFNMPVGEAVDPVIKEFIWSGSPDLYEWGSYCLVYNVFKGIAPSLDVDELNY